jgi:hypothetical protein
MEMEMQQVFPFSTANFKYLGHGLRQGALIFSSTGPKRKPP